MKIWKLDGTACFWMEIHMRHVWIHPETTKGSCHGSSTATAPDQLNTFVFFVSFQYDQKKWQLQIVSKLGMLYHKAANLARDRCLSKTCKPGPVLPGTVCSGWNCMHSIHQQLSVTSWHSAMQLLSVQGENLCAKFAFPSCHSFSQQSRPPVQLVLQAPGHQVHNSFC